LDDPPPYQALSYTWGDLATTNTITLNGTPFAVRENLCNFLNRWRQALQPMRFLWIDAICINQESIPERNHQVGMMGRIYSTATSVIAWLGVGNAVIEQTMKDWHKLDFDTTLYDSQGYIDGFNRKQNLTMCMNAIQQLCSQDYWKRMWIVQEYTLAKK
ncbi:heterokaryon incompatibility, partial [Pyrenochaeta sp. MPI-SDFR-AT-0127]